MLASLRHHARFYSAALLGLAAFALAQAAGLANAPLIGGDVFYATFLLMMLRLVWSLKPQDLKKRARRMDEGMFVVVLVTLSTMGFFCLAVFEALASKKGVAASGLVLAGMGALLGWFVLHAVMAFHYADLFYFEDPKAKRDVSDLEFPACSTPGPWDFFYFSFVIGMTAQVSDVQVRTSVMRRAVLCHGVASFFFNTVFIAMAVNAAVALAT